MGDGQVRCWGWLLDTPLDSIPTEIPGIRTSELDVGETSACARVDQGWKCWGGSTNTPGGAAAASQIVDGAPSELFGDGCQLDAGHLRCADEEETWLSLRGVVDVTRTSDTICVLRHERVECHEYYGESPTVIRVPDSVSIHGTVEFGCVLTKRGEVHCWAEGTRAKRIELPGKQIDLAVTTGFDQACARDEAGSVRCWWTDEPPVVAAVSNIVELHAGSEHACARDRAGAIRGSEMSGQRARLSAEYVTRPTLIITERGVFSPSELRDPP